jgi:DNA-binding MarR family transcriptional regulator
MYISELGFSSNASAVGAEVFRVREIANPISPVEVERIWQQRRERLQHFPAGLFADPAWDMLLHLYATELFGARTTVKGVVRAAHVPDTTGLRWLNNLVTEGLCEKSPDYTDARRQFVTLTDAARSAMDEYFRSIKGAQQEELRYAA